MKKMRLRHVYIHNIKRSLTEYKYVYIYFHPSNHTEEHTLHFNVVCANFFVDSVTLKFYLFDTMGNLVSRQYNRQNEANNRI